MAITFTIWKEYKVGGVLTEPDSIYLSDENEEYGVRRSDTHEVIVEDATAMTEVKDGIYYHEFTGIEYGLNMDYSIEIVYNGSTTYTTDTITFSFQWVSSSDADTYFATRYGASDYWVSGIEKDYALRSAQWELFACDKYKLPHPMTGHDGVTTIFPKSVEAAICEQALYRLIDTGEERRSLLKAQGVTRAGAWEETYERMVAPIFIAPRAHDFLRADGFCLAGSGGLMPRDPL